MINFLYFILGFLMMEIFGWAIHKYLMHGPLWGIHKTHHGPSRSFFELNDLFSLLFGSVAMLLIFLGVGDLDPKFWIGVGISAYGMSYFILHDLLIHKRVKVFKRPSKGYLEAMFKAHQAHHAKNTKNDAVSFGLFLIPTQFLKKDKR
jgi:beta-carotene 3-hydroxylase